VIRTNLQRDRLKIPVSKTMYKPVFVILMIVRGGFNGTNGRSTALCRLAERVSSQGGKIVFLAYDGIIYPDGLALVRGCGGDIVTSAGSGIPGKRLSSLASLVRTTYRLCKAMQPDLIVGQYSRGGNAAGIVGRLIKRPAIRVARGGLVNVRGGRERFGSLLRRRFHGLMGNLATVTIAVSHNTAAYEASCGTSAERIRVIHSGMSSDTLKTTRAKGDMRAELQIPQDAPALLIGAYLVPVKGHVYLFDALARLKNECPYLIVAGDGPLWGELADRAMKLGIESNIRFLGRRTDMGDLLIASDCVVLPSTSEALPGILLEAMAFSLPIIASRVGGIPELVKHGETGILVDARNVAGLERAIRDFLAYRDKWREIGICGNRYLRENFDLERKLQEEIDLYVHTIMSRR